MFSLAVESKSRGDEDKISTAFRRCAEEDPCFISERGTGGELVIRGMGEVQLRTYLGRMARQYKLEVETKPRAFRTGKPSPARSVTLNTPTRSRPAVRGSSPA